MKTSEKGLTIWFTGLVPQARPRSARRFWNNLRGQGRQVEWLDGDVVRQYFSKGLGYSKEDRDENIRRIGLMAEKYTRQGYIVLVSAISPYRATRAEVRERIGSFLEVYVHAPLSVCEQRDLKGIYRRARAGEIQHVTGIDDPYEHPLAPDVECRTDLEKLENSVAKVYDAMERWFAAASGQPASA